ncbi:MAG: DinB family protein [Gemmatimonadota bacterium]
MRTELNEFVREWERHTEGTHALLESLPQDQYDFRPDAGGRSVGELAWHLAELDGYVTRGIEQRRFTFGPGNPPGLTRPRTIAELAPAFLRVHADAVARIAQLEPQDWAAEMPYADGSLWTIGDLLERKLLMHSIHHRGQLTVLCRLAGGVPPDLFGQRREEASPRPQVAGV